MDNGGPAFPVLPVETEDYSGSASFGMTLRDYFAAAVLPAVLHWQTTAGNPITFNAEMTAEAAYDLADAMMERREK